MFYMNIIKNTYDFFYKNIEKKLEFTFNFVY